ncbi:helix-turn-helix transcriptional regulator [Anditalea andensis]|uniref:helix-turn-helix transcriptional regulator n=1 Tax=Anditalea andensis TaxID=1048983 RepID=UPI0013DEE50A|nr:LuxR C-terminal-related transcriptional regulator [Anditalea andensis]
MDIIEQLKNQDKYKKLFRTWGDKGTLLEREEEMIQELENLNLQINSGENLIIGSFDYRDYSLAYFTDNIFDVSGLPVEYFKKYGLEATMSMFHEDDRDEMIQFHQSLLPIYDKLTIEEKKTFGCTYTYRWVHRITNEHIWQVSSLIPYITDQEGNIIYDLQIVVRLNSVPNPAAFNWEYHYIASNGTKRKVEKQFEQISFDVLSKREKQIVDLMVQGKTSLAMSEELGVSPNTVITHRKNILRKLKVKNVLDLMNKMK